MLPYITYDVDKKYIKGQKYSPSGKTLTSVEEVIDTIANSKVVVIGNFAGTEYNATITSECVEVGCQTISKDTVKELYDLMLKSPNHSYDWDGKSNIYIELCDKISYTAWLQLLENLGYSYAENCGVASISEAIETNHWNAYNTIKINAIDKVISGYYGTMNAQYSFDAWDITAWKMVINLSEGVSSPPQTLVVGDYTATVYSDLVIIANHKITKENIELVLKHFNELSN